MSVIHNLLDPVVGAVFLLLGSLVAGHYRKVALARGLVIFTALALIATIAFPVAALVARPLEDAYPRPATLPARIDGILVLSGGVRTGIAWSREVRGEDPTALRMIAAADLARRYPQARLIFSGTTGGSAQAQAVEFEMVERAFRELGMAPGRAEYERHSLDTWENLVFSKQMARPKAGETWVLVTSATHMRRAMGVTRRVGWTMVPWPSDYASATEERYQPWDSASRNLQTLTDAMHEWVGLAVYAVEGKLA